ncbi:MAG: adenylyltransferase/cytidyltransferase family protein [Acidimicrobiia bacterium]|nr:adenylyltransferase/cytidyltransferase family protein [Acidimicrobiia bacterium]
MIPTQDGTDARFRRKIKTLEELRDIIGPRPRERKVIMCHGTFDLVHPGHLRHLMYARSKADVLVASLTADTHISKAHYRPFVPQALRALNLAALEVVDYVIVDQHPTPLENLAYLQPDYFAKGYEYTEGGGLHPRTQQEVDVLNTYGGEVIFTPGDVVFSSSRFIEETPPSIGIEKLMALMESEGVTFDGLRRAIDACRGLRVHVLGDTIVDSYVYCNPIGSSTSKTPTLSVKLEEEVHFAGGAAVVARHMQAAGAQVTFSTVLGDDTWKDFVLAEMERHGVECRAVIDPTRPTTQKAAYIAGGYRLLKVDRVDNRPISEKIVGQFVDELRGADVDAYVFSDFRHGIFGRATIPELTGALRKGPLRVADSQVASRWGNILDFQGFDLITPNEKEARFSLADQDSVVRPLAMELYRRANCRVLIMKMGARGIMTYRAPNADVRSFFTVDAFASPVVDPVGAGDALLAYATLSLRATGNPVVASILATMAAGVACEHDGNTPVTPDQVLGKLAVIEKRVQYA